MAFPATSASTIGEALSVLRQSAARLKNGSARFKEVALGQNVSSNQLISFMVDFQSTLVQWQTLAATPGLAQHAKDQLANAGLDLVGEYTAMRAAAQAIIDWVQNNFPKDGNGYLLKDKFDPSGGLMVRHFSPAQLAPLVTLMDNFIATVD